uniref:Cytochrome c oxidase subunit 3 n=1 Tax=Eoacmaea sp. AORI_YK\|nr:cytochrome c oxidase subunit III [Eoacmaea sp. AORI_YK\
MMFRNPFHMVSPSPWPIMGSLSALVVVVGIIGVFYEVGFFCLLTGLMMMSLTMFLWWRDVCRESLAGFHTKIVQSGLRLGMVLFIVSEVCFFFAFFWSYFHSSLSVTFELGLQWPPVGVVAISPSGVPLLNTVILLTSGLSVTWAHYGIIRGSFFETFLGLALAVILGFYFIFIQLFEYKEASFTISDSVYGSVFFVATGFHGLHVLIGSIFLLVMVLRLYLHHFSTGHHFGFEAACWYWHFVDVVWLFLYIFVYWWGY